MPKPASERASHNYLVLQTVVNRQANTQIEEAEAEGQECGEHSPHVRSPVLRRDIFVRCIPIAPRIEIEWGSMLLSYAELCRDITALRDQPRVGLPIILLKKFSLLPKNPNPRVRILIFKGCKDGGTIFLSILPRGSPQKEVTS